jgi:Skp family chaperone for outer membrane proteins
MKHFLLSFAVVLLTVSASPAIPVTSFIDTETFVKRAQDIVIAKCVGPVPDSGPFEDGLYPVDVDVVFVIKGAKKPGKLKVATIYPMEAGKTYLLTSLGGSALGADFLAVPELAVVEVPSRFRLEDLRGKKAVQQVQTVFAARRHENDRQRRLLEQEKKLLDKALFE